MIFGQVICSDFYLDRLDSNAPCQRKDWTELVWPDKITITKLNQLLDI
jgi:hypothetical protein